MFLAVPLIVVLSLSFNVHATNETIVQGWTPEPDGRGTWSILWSCLATVFLCTFSVLHLDVPEHHGRTFLLRRKVGWMFGAAIAPEFILLQATLCFFTCRHLLKYLRSLRKTEWTLTHLQFAMAEGFKILLSANEHQDCSFNTLRELVEEGKIDRPPIAEDELKSRGKSDVFVKLIALIQIVWFVVQILFRAIQHYPVTAIEIMTVAFVLCSTVSYGFYFNQPQDVEYPVFITLEGTLPAKGGGASLERSFPEPARAEIGSKTGSHSSRLPRRATTFVSEYKDGWTQDYLPWILMALFGCGFGGIHCLAWNSPFPTSGERLAWRICSIAATVIPIPLTFLFYISYQSDSVYYIFIFSHVSIIYALGRITLIVLSFTTLRALPADAFRTVNWNNYFPHFAA